MITLHLKEEGRNPVWARCLKCGKMLNGKEFTWDPNVYKNPEKGYQPCTPPKR